MGNAIHKIKQRKEKFKQSKLRQNRFRNYAIVTGVILGAIIALIYRVFYWMGAMFKISTIFTDGNLLSDLVLTVFLGCLVGGLLGFIFGTIIIKYRLRYS
jgi:hypothetical protein